MHDTTSNRNPGTRTEAVRPPGLTEGLIVLLVIVGILYMLARTIFIFYADYPALDKILAVCFLIAEAFVLFHGVGFFVSVYRMNRHKTTTAVDTVPSGTAPSVAILVPARHEPREVLENTFTCLHNLDYPGKVLYLLDDSSEEKYRKEAEEIAAKYKAHLFRREERHGAKAGIINDCAGKLQEKYIAVLDADQNPMPAFLSRLVPILEADPKLAFVQTPQFYSNMKASRVAFASQFQQSVFYEYVCEAKSSSQAMICCGTNVIFRREALLDVGGLDESTVTEDFATSMAFHEKGWKTLYYNHVYTFGMGPEDLGSYFKQQSRWAMGNITVLRRILRKLLTAPRSLSPVQWFEYITTGSYYLIGWAYLFLIFCPVLFIFLNIPSFFMNPVIYVLTFIPYILLSYAVFYRTMMGRRYRARDLFKGQLLLLISLPVYARAALYGIAGIKGSFQVTSKAGTRHVPYLSLWPQLVFWAVNLAALTWGLNRFAYERTAAVAINVLWITYHFLLLSSIFYFNENEE